MRIVPKQSSAAFLDVVYRPAMTHEDRSKGMWTLLRLSVSQQRPSVAWKDTAALPTTGPSVNKHVQGAVHADSGLKTPTRASENDERMTCLAFCELLLRRRGPVCHLVHISGKRLVDRRRVEPASQDFAPQPSQLLSDLWKHRTLSDDGKLLLAHSIAKSVWEFYDTEFMPRRWTAADIAFVPERGPGERLHPAHPFAPLVLSPAQQNLDKLDHEFVPNEGLVHWAPRIFSLGVLLTRIMSDNDVTIPSNDVSWQERFNSEFFYCRETILRDDWPSLKLRNKYVQTTLRTAILACLGGEIFNNDSWNVEDRRAALQKHLVAPLESLLSVVGAKEQSAAWQPRANETDYCPAEPTGRGSALASKNMYAFPVRLRLDMLTSVQGRTLKGGWTDWLLQHSTVRSLHSTGQLCHRSELGLQYWTLDTTRMSRSSYPRHAGIESSAGEISSWAIRMSLMKTATERKSCPLQ